MRALCSWAGCQSPLPDVSSTSPLQQVAFTMSFLETSKTLPRSETGSCSTDPGSGIRRQSRCDRRQLWNRERLYLLKRAQDNAARQRQQAELRRLTDQLLGVLAHLEGSVQQGKSPPQHHQVATIAANRAATATAPPPTSRGSWLREHLDMLADLDLIEH